MRISDELRDEFRSRHIALIKHAAYCDERVVELLEEADGFKEWAAKERAKADEIQEILSAVD